MYSFLHGTFMACILCLKLNHVLVSGDRSFPTRVQGGRHLYWSNSKIKGSTGDSKSNQEVHLHNNISGWINIFREKYVIHVISSLQMSEQSVSVWLFSNASYLDWRHNPLGKSLIFSIMHRENGGGDLSGKTQGIWKYLQKQRKLSMTQVMNSLILKMTDLVIFAVDFISATVCVCNVSEWNS